MRLSSIVLLATPLVSAWGAVAHNAGSNPAHVALRRNQDSSNSNGIAHAAHGLVARQDNDDARPLALKPSQGLAIESVDLGQTEGTDCECECQTFDDIMETCLKDHPGSNTCACKEDSFEAFIQCSRCDTSYYKDYKNGLRGFVTDALEECKVANRPVTLALDISTLPTTAIDNASSTDLASSTTRNNATFSAAAAPTGLLTTSNGNRNATTGGRTFTRSDGVVEVDFTSSSSSRFAVAASTMLVATFLVALCTTMA